MEKLYFVRHQNEGVLHQFPFKQPPTQAQMEPIVNELARRHGTHAKQKVYNEDGTVTLTKGDELFFRIIEVEVLGPNDMPQIAPQRTGPSISSTADVPTLSVRAEARVDPPE
jgi:hypothetical protein